MICNVGMWDKTLRFGVGVAIMAIGASNNNWFGMLAIIPFATAVYGYCPIYAILGISTRNDDHHMSRHCSCHEDDFGCCDDECECECGAKSEEAAEPKKAAAPAPAKAPAKRASKSKSKRR